MQLRPGNECSWAQLAKLINSAFEGYIGNPVSQTAGSLEAYCTANLIPRELGYVFFPSEEATEPVAFLFLAVRDDRPGMARVASMGVVPTYQEKGTGSKVLQTVIEAERKRGTRLLELECIDQNERGVRLYSRGGFAKHRRLVGWEQMKASIGEAVSHPDLQSCTLEEVDAVVSAHAAPDLPWQARGFATLQGSVVSYRLDHAYCTITDPEAEEKTVMLRCLIVEPEWRGQGQAKRLAQAVMAKYPGKKFQAMPLFPEEYGEKLGPALGLQEIGLKQFQMRLELS